MFVDTNWADVADKLVDKVSGATAQIAEKLGSAAPQVWRAALLQTRLYGIENFIYAGLAAVLFRFFVAAGKHFWKATDENADNMIGVILVVGLGCAISLIASLVAFSSALNYTINPAYWTVVDMLSKLRRQ